MLLSVILSIYITLAIAINGALDNNTSPGRYCTVANTARDPSIEANKSLADIFQSLGVQ